MPGLSLTAVDELLIEATQMADVAEWKRNARTRLLAASLRTPAEVLAEQHRWAAIHEIGHAARALLLYGRPGFTWLIATPAGGWCGESAIDVGRTIQRADYEQLYLRTAAPRSFLAADLEIGVAGVALEDLIAAWPHGWTSCHDPESLWAAELLAGPERAMRVRQEAYERVMALFARLRLPAHIDALIAELVTRSRLPGAEVAQSLAPLSAHFGHCPAGDYSEVQ